jgi:hypothetical protein
MDGTADSRVADQDPRFGVILGRFRDAVASSAVAVDAGEQS